LEILERNPSLITLLAPRIGYLRAAEIAREAIETGTPIRRLVTEKGIMDEKEAEEFFDPLTLSESQYRVSGS
jgi:aspartate ammonia-lyase